MQAASEKNIAELREKTKVFNQKIWKIINHELEDRFKDKTFISILKYVPEARTGYGANRPYSAYLGYLYGGGEPENENIMKICAAMEVMNTSITYIDDKIFDDDLYVGKRISLHKRFELPLAIIASSILRSVAKSIIIEIAPASTLKEIMKEVDSISQNADYGQYLDVTYGHRFKANISDAIKINDLRTGQFIHRAAEIGYLFSGKNDEKERKFLHDSFKLYGRSVQDANDLDDVNFTEHSPGSHGMDIKLFKKTKPIIKALELANEDQLEILYNIFGNPNTTKELVIKGCNIIKECGAFEWTINDIIRTIEQAIEIINKSNNPVAEHIAEYFYIVKHIMKEQYYGKN